MGDTTAYIPPPQVETAAQVAHDNPEAVTRAVAVSHAGQAPPDADNQRMAALENRFASIETFIRKYEPILEAAGAQLAADVPSLDPVINRVSALETWAMELLNHFNHKIPAPVLPAPVPPATT